MKESFRLLIAAIRELIADVREAGRRRKGRKI